MSSSAWVDRSAPYLAPAPGGSPDPWTAEAAAQGRKGSQRVLRAGLVPAPPEIALALGVDPGAAVVERTRLVMLDGDPVEIASSYYPEEIGRGTALAEPGRISGGAVSLLARLGYVGDQADERVSSRPPTADERDLLGISDSEWVLHLARTVRSSDGSAIQADNMTMLARGRALHYTVKIG